MFGTDVVGIAAVADIEAVGYAADPERVRLDLEAYRPPGGWPDELVLEAARVGDHPPVVVMSRF
jgi:hypothetical protein